MDKFPSSNKKKILERKKERKKKREKKMTLIKAVQRSVTATKAVNNNSWVISIF
jgi:hypothetical protein